MKQRAICLTIVVFIIFTLFGCDSPGQSAGDDPAIVVSKKPQTTEAVLTPVHTNSPSPVLTSEEPTPKPTETPEGMVLLNEDFYFVPLDESIKERITGLSYPSNDSDAAINYDDLRYIHILHVDFEGSTLEGELIVNKNVAEEVMEIFHALYVANYPLTSVNLVDNYGEAADDNISMAANNTSAFNYRVVAGSKKLSMHSYGLAIDINPLLNPYVKRDGSVSPIIGKEYADRSENFQGKIDHDDLCYKLFIEHGWTWGGDWKSSKDYQHFSKELD